MCDETVKQIYSFEILSSTEWNFPLTFSPNVFFNITDTISLKKKAMKEYESEICDSNHPRSINGIELSSKFWGLRTGNDFVEAFQLIRSIL